MTRRLTHILNILTLLMGVLIVYQLYSTKPVLAMNRALMPDPTDYTVGANVYLEVSRSGLGNGLDAPTSSVRIYLDPLTGGVGTVRIHHWGHCSGSGIDTNVFAPTQFVAYRVRADDWTDWGSVIDYDPTNPSIEALNVTAPDMPGCSGYRDYPLSGLVANNTPGGYQGWYVAEFYAAHTGTSGGVNAFKLEMLTPGGLIGFSKNATNKFALQDRISPQGTLANFTLTFAPDCILTNPVTRTLEWFDDDWNVLQSNSDYRSYLVEKNSNGVITSTVSVSPPWYGGDAPGSFSVTIRPAHKYEWIWENVTKINGIQFKLPYDSINYTLPCPGGNTGGGGTTTSAACQGQTITITNRPNNCQSQYCWNAPAPPPGGSVFIEVWGGEMGSAFLVTTSSGSGCTTISYTMNGVANALYYFYDSAGAPAGSGSISGRTYFYCQWQYAHSSDLVNSTSPTFPKPNDRIQITSYMVNYQDGLGPEYLICIYPDPVDGTANWLTNSGRPTALSGCIVDGSGAACAGSGVNGKSNGPVHSATWTLRPDVPHGQQLCFYVSHTPISGLSGPIISVTNNGVDTSPRRCFTVYNLRYDISQPVVALPAYLYSGDTVSVPITIANSDGPLPTGAQRGPSFNTRITASVTNATLNRNSWGPVTIGPLGAYVTSPVALLSISINSPVGTQVCLTVTATTNIGYSDGGTDGAGNGPTGSEIYSPGCITVKEGPYLRAYGNDIWAGAIFESAGVCTGAPTNGDIRGLARQAVAGPLAPNYVGAAAKYGALAEFVIDTFGSNNRGDEPSVAISNTGADYLKFANTPPPPGSIGAAPPRCITDLFNKYYNSPATVTLAGLNNINSQNAGQYRVTGSATLQNVNNLTDRITVLVNGDLTITNNVEYLVGNSTSYGASLPIFLFIVNGNINIEAGSAGGNATQQLNGIYIATGEINTCSDGPANLSSSDVCARPLEINGALIARSIAFRRTGGGLNGVATGSNAHQCVVSGYRPTPASSFIAPFTTYNAPLAINHAYNWQCAAEVIRFLPEIYLSRPILDDGSGQDDYKIQQYRDLPPVF